MDQLDKQLLAEIQYNLPIAERPYLELGRIIGISEAEVIGRIRKLHEAGLIRRWGAFFDSRSLGYTSTLCAMEVPPDRLDEVAAVINGFAGVTHNYLRQHHYNLWFTLIAPSATVVADTIREIEAKTGLTIHNLPAVQVFKINAVFPIPGAEEAPHGTD